MVEDAFHTLWIGTGTVLYRRRTDGRIERYRSAVMPDTGAKQLREDAQGRLLVATGLGFFSCMPTVTGCSGEQFWDNSRGLSGDYVMDTSSGADGAVWVVTFTALHRIIPGERSGLARVVASSVDLGDVPLEAVADDGEGNVWVGTDGGGVSRISAEGMVSYSERDGLGSHGVISVFEDARGQLFAVTRSRNGLFLNRFTGEKFEAIRLNVDPRRVSPIWHGHYQVIATVAEREWWVATHQGLAHFTGIRDIPELSRSRPRYELEGANLFRIFPDRQGNVWISEQPKPDNMLKRWNPLIRGLEEFPARSGGPSLMNDRVQAYVEDRAGQVWMGLLRGGLWRFSSQGFRWYELPKELAGPINWLHADRAGRIWLGTSVAGTARIDGPEKEHDLPIRYTSREGLSSNEVLCITEDLAGNIYVCTARGVDRLDPGTGRVKHFTTANGLAFGELQTAFRDRRGWLWFGTQQGLSRLIPTLLPLNKAPAIAITAVRAGGAAIAISPAGETEVSLPDLPSGRAQVQFEFVGLGLRAGDVLRYQYSLRGAANDWSAPGAERTVNYAELRPGSYRFLVRAVNSDGLTTAQPAWVQFTVLPPIWMRWWFVSSALATVGLAIWSGWRYRSRQLAAVHRVRMRITADLHDDIGSSLSQIAILSELARRSPEGGNPQPSGLLDQIADVSRELVDSMSDIVWATDPRRDRLGDLAQRMRQFAGEVLGASNIEFRFDAAGIERDSKLSVSARRQIFLIFKESIHNVIRHSKCTQARASLERSGNWIVLKVWDNGIGFDVSGEHEGHGLASMRERAGSLGGEFECASGAGGTTVRLRAPLRV